MVAILEKSDAAEGFEQIIEFLSGSYINHALTVNPYVYISCIKQFWNTAVVKCSGDVTRLQALVDKKRIVISEEVVHEILVGKGFSRVVTPLFENILVVRDVAEEAEAYVLAQGDDVQEHAAEEVATDVVPPTPTSPSPSSPRVLYTCYALVFRVEGLENDKVAQQLEIVKLKARVKKLEKISKIKSSKLRRLKKVGTSQRVKSSNDVENVFNQERMIVDMDKDEGIELVADQEKDTVVDGRHADKQAEIYNIDLDHSSKVLSMQEDDTKVVAASTPIPAAKPKTLTITAAPAVLTRRRKGVVIRDPKEELSSDTPFETPKVKDKGKGILIKAPRPMKKKDQIKMDAEYAKKLQEEINKEHEESYKNIDWNAALDHVQSKEPHQEKKWKQKMKRLSKASMKHLHRRQATPLAQKVPVVDYQIVVIDNKP
nr:hypothetical protein [Tanacetum cinerariifolium]